MTASNGGAAGNHGLKPLRPGDPAEVGRFRPAARLGTGGMGTVYLAHTPGGQPVALKVVRPELAEAPDFRRRFEQEVRAARRVQGLYTVPVLDADTEGPMPWLATAYVAGPSLSEAVTLHGPLPEATVLLLVAGVAEALQTIHAAGVVHRDLKPSNVLLAADGPRVIDFGIARATDATSLTGTDSRIGTPAFMAPEQITTGEVGPQADIFALGLLAHYAATARGAFGEGDPQALLYRVVHDEPDLSRLPAGLWSLIGGCLAKDPAARPAPDRLIEACRGLAPGAELRRDTGWLPAGVTEEIAARAAHRAPAPPGPAAPGAHGMQPGPATPPSPATPATPATPAGGFGGFGPVLAHTPPPPGATPGLTPHPGPPPAGEPPAPRARRRTRIVVLAAAVATAVALLTGGGYAAGVFGGGGGQASGAGSTDGTDSTDGPEETGTPGGGDAAAPAVPGSSPAADSSPSATEDPADDAEEQQDPQDGADPGGDGDSPGGDDRQGTDDRTGADPGPTESAKPDPEPTRSDSPEPTRTATTAPDPGAPGRKYCTYAADRDRAWAEGHAGESVKEIQCLLNRNYGYGLDVDGIFGPLTDDAVRDIQRCSGIAVDGEVGPDTWGYLDNPKPSCV
ncbi:serine/threonine-protein kinase [Streptomyces aidingensis]|uniref:Serine/threonine protein kinase n=1 Tax=Streptomyces aidingensis TaxID=910347 RepID=A0A1I1H721_9ACTN|nr:serine/threonine-protein kinase [Streptomyces aidingensis]SFC16950.1 Serine/threonine protein kinase [Streptomyces aidingensis]